MQEAAHLLTPQHRRAFAVRFAGETADIVRRLRKGEWYPSVIGKAADRCEFLQTEVNRLTKELPL
jgi:hypothetical protein